MWTEADAATPPSEIRAPINGAEPGSLKTNQDEPWKKKGRDGTRNGARCYGYCFGCWGAERNQEEVGRTSDLPRSIVPDHPYVETLWPVPACTLLFQDLVHTSATGLDRAVLDTCGGQVGSGLVDGGFLGSLKFFRHRYYRKKSRPIKV